MFYQTKYSGNNFWTGLVYHTNLIVVSVLIIPNVFTPNGDGINDIFTMQSSGLATLDAVIYNRWGQQLYEWHTINGGWDGYASGVPAPNGTYYYRINATGIDGKIYSEQGSFALIR
jgi:gliding motility-associated-like protein